MARDLPPALRKAAERLLQDVPRNELAERAARLSANYRGGRGSGSAVSIPIDAVAYLFSRMPGTFAATDAVLGEVRMRCPGFAPATLLDAGSGPGTASWAAVETWSDIAMVTMIDTNPTFLDIARRLTAASGHDALARTESRRRDILAIAEELAADLVVASFALTELGLHQEAATRLWRVTGAVLVVIEPGTPAGFACIRAVRKTLIAQGARVVAPCPHDEACPIVAPDWCHFVQRLGRSRDHRLVKAATAPFEDEKFSYVALARSGLAVARPAARVLSRPRIGKADIRLKLCAPGGLVERLVRRRDRVAYAGLRRIRWGDAIDDR